MRYLAISILIFVSCAVTHLLLHRLMLKYFSKTNKVTVIYLFGLIALILIFNGVTDPKYNWLTQDYALSSILIYICLVVFFNIICATPYLGDESPTSKLVLLILYKKTITKKEILKYFSSFGVIEKRLADMEQSRWVLKKGDRYYATKSAEKIGKFVVYYRSLLGFYI